MSFILSNEGWCQSGLCLHFAISHTLEETSLHRSWLSALSTVVSCTGQKCKRLSRFLRRTGTAAFSKCHSNRKQVVHLFGTAFSCGSIHFCCCRSNTYHSDPVEEGTGEQWGFDYTGNAGYQDQFIAGWSLLKDFDDDEIKMSSLSIPSW